MSYHNNVINEDTHTTVVRSTIDLQNTTRKQEQPRNEIDRDEHDFRTYAIIFFRRLEFASRRKITTKYQHVVEQERIGNESSVFRIVCPKKKIHQSSITIILFLSYSGTFEATIVQTVWYVYVVVALSPSLPFPAPILLSSSIRFVSDECPSIHSPIESLNRYFAPATSTTYLVYYCCRRCRSSSW